MVAELRGRYREQLKQDSESPAAKFDRTGNSLPLQEERSTRELAIEVERAIIALAGELKLKVDAKALRRTTSAAKDAVGSDNWSAAWNALAEQLYKVDAGFQDDLYADALPGAAAYQLGRGLAEVTWALDASAVDGPTSLSYLLGTERVETMKRLLQRLRKNIDEVTAAAVASTLEAWSPTTKGWPDAIAAIANANHDQKEALQAGQNATVAALRDQARVWHDLLLDQVPWQTLVNPNAAIRRRPSLRPLTPFLAEMVLGTLGLTGLVVALGLLSLGNQGGWATFVALVSATGVTAATVRARVKDQAQNLIGQMRRAFNMELAAEAVLRPPPVATRLTSPSVRRAGTTQPPAN